MAKIPPTGDPTLQSADAALVRASKQRHSRRLGASWVGDECERRMWFRFRHAKMPSFDAKALKRFADGYAVEDVVVARIKAAGVDWNDKGEDGKQYGFSDLGGHFVGFYDGVVLGLHQAPKTWHIGEVKATEKWKDLDKAKDKFGEKNALAQWNPVYYAQGQISMHYEGVDRHYLVAASPGARDWTSCRTDYDPVAAMKLKAKAERVIFGEQPAPRIGDKTYFACKWCDMFAICHEQELPERSCRGCIHATPERDGDARWSCAEAEFGTVCERHRFIPAMLNFEQTDVVNGGDIVYRKANGEEWIDDGKRA